MKFATSMALAAAVMLTVGAGFTAAQANDKMGVKNKAAMHHVKKIHKSKMTTGKMTTGSGVGTTTGPKSGIQGKAPGAVVSPNSQQANPAKNSK